MKEYKINLESLRGKNGMNDFEVMFILPMKKKKYKK